jgi:prophage regulatory protein
MERFLRIGDVVERVGLSRVSVWRRERDGDFPRRVKLGPNSVAWKESEIAAWMESRERTGPRAEAEAVEAS